jgi:hypothetical protein
LRLFRLAEVHDFNELLVHGNSSASGESSRFSNPYIFLSINIVLRKLLLQAFQNLYCSFEFWMLTHYLLINFKFFILNLIFIINDIFLFFLFIRILLLGPAF